MVHSLGSRPPRVRDARVWDRLCALLAFVILLTPACASPPPARLEAPSELASARGKYAGLRMAFERAGDYEKFGSYADVGQKPAASWRGLRAPAGYWVYVYPTWYLWDREAGATAPAPTPASSPVPVPTAVLAPVPLARAATSPPPPRATPLHTTVLQESAIPSDEPAAGSCPMPPDPTLGCSEDPGDSASACGRYASLLRVIFRPQARREFPDYHLGGWREPGAWQGAKGVPGGFWVYVYPNWYVWEKEVAVPAMRAD